MPLTIHGIEAAGRLELPWPDIYYTPAYGRCLEESEAAHWELALWEPGPILYPYLLRPVQSASRGRCWDVVSPYGYAGPWAPENVGGSAWAEFRTAFRNACRDRNIVSEFVRFHPLFPMHDRACAADPMLEALRHGSTVSIDLARDHDVIWKSYEGRARTAIRKAQSLGYHVRLRPVPAADTASRHGFRRLYERTMQRVEAGNYYFFNDSYYDTLWSALASQLLLGEVLNPREEVVAAALFFTHDHLLHYHLAGSDSEHARFGINNLLLDAVARHGTERGALQFHLGGGLKEGDSLYRFKSSLGRVRHEYWIGRAVLMPEVYQELVRERAARAGVEPTTLVESGFFPAYRATIPTAMVRSS